MQAILRYTCSRNDVLGNLERCFAITDNVYVMGSVEGACNCKNLSPRDCLAPWYPSTLEYLELGNNRLEVLRGHNVKFTEGLQCVKLFPTPEYTSKQSSDPVVPLVPCTGISLGPSKPGKLVLEQDRGVFERIYIFSPSINIDDGWIPVKKYIEEDLGVNTEREQACWDEWDEAAAAAQDHGGVQEVGDEETVPGPENL